jgi:hypothetical protein
MKIMKRKTIIYILSVIAVYYFLSVYFTKNGQFIQYYFSNSDSKKESVEKEIFITDELNVLYLKDSADIVKKNFDIWLDKKIMTRRFGFLPIKVSTEKVNFYSCNINFKPNAANFIKDNISYRFNNEEYTEFEMGTLEVKKGKKIKVDFYFKKKLVSVIEVKIPK